MGGNATKLPIEPKTLEGHTHVVTSVVFHPTIPNLIATSSQDYTAKIWNTDTGECTMTLKGHRNSVTSVAFHPTYPTLLATGSALQATGSYDNTASNDNTARIWKIDTGACTKTLEGHTDGVYSVAFHPTNPTLLATGSEDNTVRIWNIDTRACVKTLEGHTNSVNSVAFHPTNPSLLATGSDDCTAKIWNVGIGECIKTLEGQDVRSEETKRQLHQNLHDAFHYPERGGDPANFRANLHAAHAALDAGAADAGGAVFSVAFHPTNPTLLVTASDDSTAKIWNIDTGECTKTLEGHTGNVFSIAFHPTNPTLLATASYDSTARIWNVDTGECTKTLEGHTGSVSSGAFHPTNPTLLATGGGDDTARICPVKLWDVPGLLHLVPFFLVELDCTKLRAADVQAFRFVRFIMFLGAGIGTKYDEAQDDEVDALLNPLPSEVWLHILSFLRLSELRFAVMPRA